ncbi:MAG: glycosyltransferase, partial [Oscillospiraceae bacterium]|nr:glycosyltransferase [Oscillospiraceae bacterium]
LNGADIVYGVRSKREKDTFFKRFTAEGYYRLLKLMGCDVVFNHADYRLLSSRALEALAEYKEHELFLRGIIPMLGYRTATVTYERAERFAGESKYPLKKMLALAFDGILSLSMKPLRLILALGVFALAVSLVLFVVAVVRLCAGHGLYDASITNFSIWFIGGLVLSAIGINNEYTGRTYMEAKDRPRYNIGESVGL